MKYKCIGLCMLAIISLCGCKKLENSDKEIETVTREIFAMDTYMSLSATGKNADEALEAAVSEINRLDNLLSTGKEKSEISVLNNSGSAYVSEDTVYLVERSKWIYTNTKGAFDITILPLMEMWGFTNKEYRVPTENEIESALKYVSSSGIQYDDNEKSVSLPEGVKIDLGGIAKGYTSDRIMQIFKEYGIESGMVSLGGNVQLLNKKPDGNLWKIGIKNPENESDYVGVVQTESKAIVTSGGYERYFEENGKAYHHIINPGTGYPAESGLISVTIVSEDGTLADGLSTALFVMGKDRAIDYWRQNSDRFDAVLVEEDGDITITKGLEGIFISDYEFEIEE